MKSKAVSKSRFESYHVTEYQYYIRASQAAGIKAVLHCRMRKDKKGVTVNFLDAVDKLPDSKKTGDNTFVMFYFYADLQAIIDMLRNEHPVYFYYDPEVQNGMHLGTFDEPVGEGDPSHW